VLRSLKSMLGYALKAEDGDIGSVIDFFFDDAAWRIRYLQADTGKWLPGKKALISPQVIGKPDWEYRKVPVKMPQDKIRKSPEVRVDDPLSRPKEEMICKYYEWPEYWCNSSGKLIGLAQVRDYSLHARDGQIGVLDDMIIDDTTWDIKYFVADIGGLILNKKVLLDPRWVDEIVDEGKEIRLDVLKDKVSSSPKYDPKEPINRAEEEVLYDYWGKPRSWKEISNPDKDIGTGKTMKPPEKSNNTALIASIILLLLVVGGLALVYWSSLTPKGMVILETTTTLGVPPQQETTQTTLMIAPVTSTEAPTTSQTIRATTTTQALPTNAPDNETIILRIRSDPKLGNILADGKGMTIYYRRTDAAMNTDCYGVCASTWPPLIIKGGVQVMSGINGKVGGLQRGGGGGRQVTYNGQPLYYYNGDKQPGETNGQGLAGNWYVVRITAP
jgi:predicted lipoprotein with Yx(FWY)xxD motif